MGNRFLQLAVVTVLVLVADVIAVLSPIPLFCLALLSFLIPKKFLWLTLAGWTIQFCLLEGYEFYWFAKGASRFGLGFLFVAAVAALCALWSRTAYRKQASLSVEV